jgi:Zn-dependent protease
VLHELGHSLVAKALAIPVREIVLLPLGGLAIMSRNPDRPVHEVLIAVAGPLVNVALALGLFLLTGPALHRSALDGRGLMAGALPEPGLTTLLLWLFQANVVLALFNLIPAFPMDGGRILRGVLGLFLGVSRATRIATVVGQILAVAMGLLGVFTGHFILVLIAVFVFLAAGSESVMTQAKSVLNSLLVGDAYNKYALTLGPADRVSTVVDYLLTSYQPDFAVVHGGRMLGVVSRNDVLKALAGGPDDVYVSSVMQRDIVTVDAATPLDVVLQTMGERGVPLVAVYRGDTFLGLVSREDLSEAMTVVSFVRRQQAARSAAARS